MRVTKLSALTLIVAAAGLSLTACQGDGASSASAASSASSSASSSTGGKDAASDSSSSSTSSSGSGTGGQSLATSRAAKSRAAAAGSLCKTDDLGFSAASTGVKNQIVVNLKNNGSRSCSMHGFPGVRLVGPDGLGDTGPDAARTDASAPTVTIAPGEETRFLLRYIADTSGHGKTYTRLSVTPPDERVSAITDLHDNTITVSAHGGHAPDVYVDPVGHHVGSGK